MFEAAIPPAIVATADLILTQVLGPKLILWHMPVNHGLGKLYPISLLYTLNTIGGFSSTQAQNIELNSRLWLGDNRELARRDARMASGNTHPRLSGRQVGFQYAFGFTPADSYVALRAMRSFKWRILRFNLATV